MRLEEAKLILEPWITYATLRNGTDPLIAATKRRYYLIGGFVYGGREISLFLHNKDKGFRYIPELSLSMGYPAPSGELLEAATVYSAWCLGPSIYDSARS